MTTHVQAIRRLVVLAMLSLSVFGCGWFGADQPVEKDPNDSRLDLFPIIYVIIRRIIVPKNKIRVNFHNFLYFK